MSKKAFFIASLLAATTAFALSQREARFAKERMARCGYNDAVCVGNILVDALAANDKGGRSAPYPGTGRQKVVVVYGSSDVCSGSLIGTVILTDGRLQEALDQCNSMSGTSWSYSIDGVCENAADSNGATMCTNAVVKANSVN